MKKILLMAMVLALLYLLLVGVSGFAVSSTPQLEPLPSLESTPNYQPPTYITFVHC